MFKRLQGFFVTGLIALTCLTAATPVSAGGITPLFSQQFQPNAIGPGSSSRLVYTINNQDPLTPGTDLAFTNVLPAALTVVGAEQNDCGGTLSAPAGGATITLTGGALAANDTCQIAVIVTGSTLGTHSNISGDLTSSFGNSGTSSDDLDILSNRPGFTKVFAPASLPLGSVGSLTFTIDNSLNASSYFNINFTDTLPPGVVLADPVNLVDTCPSPVPIITANPGGSLFSYNSQSIAGALPAGSTCTLQVDVLATNTGVHLNVSTDLFAQGTSAGLASANLEVTTSTVLLQKDFTDDPVPPGGVVNLQYTLNNFDRFDATTNIAFSDDLNAALPGLTAINTPLNNVCGAGSVVAGGGIVTLVGGSLPAEGFCSFNVQLQVPAGAVSGSYPSTSGAVSYDLNGNPEVGNTATAVLSVSNGPVLGKTYLTNPVFAGDTVSLEFTVTNPSLTDPMTEITFFDRVTENLSGATYSNLPPTPCGAGSIIFVIADGINGDYVQLSNGNLAAGDSCTFAIDVTVPAGTINGVYENITSTPTGVIGGNSESGTPAQDDLVVISAPDFSKSFTDDPVQPGDTVTLEFNLTHSEGATTAATGINFTDDLNAVLPGLVAVGLPLNDVCGLGSQISGTGLLSFTGGSLNPNESCVFSVTLQVPAGAATGSYTNTTTPINATVSGLNVTGMSASDDLVITEILFSKVFINNEFYFGVPAAFQVVYTIENLGTGDATAGSFTDNLLSVAPGLSYAPGLPQNDVCGLGSSVNNVGPVLVATGLIVPAGTTCTITVDLDLNGSTPLGNYSSLSSNLSVQVGGPVTIPPAIADFDVIDALFGSKSFTDDPATAGGTVTLEFVLQNDAATENITALTFTDDLDAMLTGAVAVGLPQNNVCGTGSQISGVSILTLTGGNLAPLSSCTFQVTLQVPAGALPGVYPNTTSQLTGTVNAQTITAPAMSDDLSIIGAAFSKAFASPAVPGGLVTLDFTLNNIDPVGALTNLAFNDDLNAMLAGAVAVGLPQNDVCGSGSQLNGTSLLTLTGGNLGPSSLCNFSVTVQVPAGAAPGAYLNTTSDLFENGLSVAAPASDTLGIEPPPTFAKAFSPNALAIGQISTLTFTIDNSASALAATALDFTDNLPAGLLVATPANATTTCTGGAITAVAGSGVISYTGGAVAAGAVCTVQADVTPTAVGALLNTSGDLTSSSGNSGPASDTLTAVPQPGFAKVFAPTAVAVGQTSTLTFTIDNSASSLAATALDFTDNLPAGVLVATPANATTTCTGGTVTAVAGSGVISYTGGTLAAGAVCTVQADVTPTAAGALLNTSGDLTSSLGNSGPASDTLTAVPQPGFSKAFAPAVIGLNQISTLTFTIDNSASTLAATALDFTDNLPAGVLVATPANASTTCTGGTVTAVAGSGVISYNGGTLAAGAVCTVQADVTGTAVGVHSNVSGDLTSSLGNSGPANADLQVVPQKAFSKSFNPATIGLNGVSTLTFVIDNSGSSQTVTGLDFTDNFPAGMLVATPANASSSCTGGTLTAVAGSGTVSYTGGSLAAGGTCTVQVDVTATATGTLSNLSGDLTSVFGNSGPAAADLEVVALATFSKAFAPTQIEINGVSTLTFTIDNSASSQAATGLDFSDTFPAGMLVATPANASSSCTGGTLTATAGSGTVSYSGGSVAAAASCTVQVDVTANTAGVLSNVSGDLTSVFGNSGPAAADLIVTDVPSLSKSFLTDPVVAGLSVDVQFTVSNPDPVQTLDNITFSDDLDAFIPGATAANLPLSDPCGVGSQMIGSNLITLSNGVLGPGQSCDIVVTVLVPPSASGQYLNVTSPLSGTINGQPVGGGAGSEASALLVVNGVATLVPLNPWVMFGLMAPLMGLVGAWTMRRRRGR